MKRKAKRKVRKKTAKRISEKKQKGAVEFCPKCGSIMIPEKKAKSIYIRCRSCGMRRQKKISDLKLSEEKVHTKDILVIENDDSILPLTEKACPKCEHTKAHWWLQQTRSADEPPTQFFRCQKCKHVWREYK